MKKFIKIVGLTCALAMTSASQAELIQLEATLTSDQEVPGGSSTAFGSASLLLDTVALTMSYQISVTGVDIDGNQTTDTDDDLTALHIHNAPAGLNGGAIFGIVNPNNDADDLVEDAISGTLSGMWDGMEGVNGPLSSYISEILAGGTYLNLHTQSHPGGAIRGQITVVGNPIPEPPVLLLFILGIGLYAITRRRRTF